MPTCAPVHTVGETSDLHLLFDLIFFSFAKRFDWKHRRMMLETGWWKMTVWKFLVEVEECLRISAVRSDNYGTTRQSHSHPPAVTFTLFFRDCALPRLNSVTLS